MSKELPVTIYTCPASTGKSVIGMTYYKCGTIKVPGDTQYTRTSEVIKVLEGHLLKINEYCFNYYGSELPDDFINNIKKEIRNVR